MSSNSSNSSKEGGEGNTKPPPSKKQISPAKRWCFTLHNYSLTNISFIIDFLNSSNSSYIFAEEKGQSGETPHLQGYINFEKKLRPVSKTSGIWDAMDNWKTVHWEPAKGNLKSQIKYITKEGGKVYKSNSSVI